MKIAIFGGSFNPIHFGHLRAAEELSQDFLDKIIFVPTNTTSNKKSPLHSPDERLKMISSVVKNHRGFEVSDIEIRRGGVSYSYETVLRFKDLYPNDDLYFIVGSDAYLKIKTWKHSSGIFNTVNFIVINRGCGSFNWKNMDEYINCLPDDIKSTIVKDPERKRFVSSSGNFIIFFNITRMDISSTLIRDNFKKNVSNRFLLPKEIIDYIIKNRIYVK